MKRLLTLLSLMIFFSLASQVSGQSITNYAFTPTSGSFTALSGGTTMALSGGTADDGYFNSVPLGFTFIYMGVPYTSISLSTNGWFTFNQTLSTSAPTNNLSTGTPRPVIAPLWDDNDIQLNTNFSYQTSGSPGSRIFTAECINVQWYWSATGNTISHQVKLYEATGAVEFVYRDEGGTVVSGSASIGITGIGTGSGNFLSLNGTGVSPAASSTTETTSLSTKPASGQTYTFAPTYTGTPADPTTTTMFTAITGTGMTVNWTDNSSNETYFVVTRATDAGFTQNVVTTSVNSTTVTGTGTAYNSIVTGLSFGTTYYFKITANNEASAPGTGLTGSQATTGGTLSGTKYVGTGSNPMDYATLTDAFTAINTSGLAGTMQLVLNTTYTTTDATFPITGPTAGAVGAYSVIIYPSVTGLSITSAGTTGTLNLNGSKNVVIDGRVGATGSTRDLVISNTNLGTSPAIQFINDAFNNTIQFCKITSRNNSTSSGTIVFSTTTGTNGNDNNSIDQCDIYDGTSTPYNAIYALGSTTTSATYNSNNIISNCNIYNFFYAAGIDYGIYLGTGNTDWTITGNSLYQTATRTMTTAATDAGIYISNSGNNFSVTNNYIGGGQANTGGTAWTIAGSVANRFRGISISVGTTTPSSIQGNTIANFNFTSNSSATTTGGPWTGIYLTSGNANIGNTSGNTIGSGTGTGSITLNVVTNSGSRSSGIFCDATSTSSSISNNVIGSISISASTISQGFSGIVTTSGSTLTINNNTIGSATTSNSINSNTGATGTTAQIIYGIYNSSSATISITNNTIANINNNYLPASANSSTILCGIFSSFGTNTITGNTIRNLSTAAQATGTASAASVIGISMTSSTAPAIVSQNTIHSLSNSHASAAVCVTGIHYGGPTTGTNLVARNFVHSFSIVSTSATADLRGINLASGLVNFQNNMVRLGIDASGGSLTTGIQITGIYDATSTTGSGVYHNSVYIGGTGSSGTSAGNTYAFRSDQTTNTRTYQDNIFVNARSNGTTTGKHYAVRVAGTGVNPTGLALNYNDYLATGTGAVFGYYNADVASLTAWKAAVGQDVNSMSGDPQFTSPVAATPDLHISASATPVEATGLAIAAVTDDFDGQTRSGLTPTDIGADAGNFTPLDIVPPAISYTILGNTTSTANRSFSNITITDASGVNITAGTMPRLYFKKSTNANALGATNDYTTDGWKYVESNGTSSPFDFTIDYSKLYSTGTVVAGEIVQYFVVAQDLATTPNVGINSGTFAAIPASVALTGAAFPLTGTINSYNISISVAGNYNVGAGQTYLTLTEDASTGFFKAVNNGVVTGNYTVTIVSDITEPGTIALNQWAEEGAGNYTLTIQPDGTTERILSGTAVTTGTPMINFNGADRVTIDGRFGGSGMYLRFRNTNATPANAGPAIQFTNSAVSNTIRNCILATNETTSTSGTVVIGATGTNSVSVLYCHLRDATGGTIGAPYNAIYSNSANNTLTISNNDIYNWSNYGLNIVNVANGCSIADNSFYNNLGTTPTVTQYSVYLAAGSGHTITGNFIGGQSASAGGSAWNNSGAITFYGIYLSAGTSSASSVQNNAIQNILLSNTGSASFYGINLAGGTINVGTTTGNTIGHASTANSISITGTGSIYGIASSGSTSTIQKNTIANITQTATAPGTFIGISLSGNFVLNASSNRIYQCGATSSSTGTNAVTGIYFSGASSGTQACTIANNMIALGQGATNNNLYKGIDDWGYTGNNLFIYYNSVRILGAGNGAQNSYAYLKRDAPNETHRNNIYVNERTGGTGYHYAIGVSNITGTFSSNYNVFNSSDLTKIGLWSATSYNLAGWQTATSGDANTITGNPGYISTTDLHINTSSTVPSNNATPLVGIVDFDFDNEARNATTPDRGADEYTFVPPAVIDPTGVTATAMSSSQIDVAFTVNGNGNNVVIIWDMDGTFTTPSGAPPIVGDPFAGGTVLSNGTTSPVNHMGLTPVTAYYYKAFSYDGSTYSPGVAVSATTQCPQLTALSENFDALTPPAIPICWNKITPLAYQTVTTYATSPNSAPNCVRLYSDAATLIADAPLLITPYLSNLNSGNHWLKFSAKGASTNLSVIVGTMSDPMNSATFTPFQTVTGLSASAWTNKIVDFSSYAGTDKYIAFKHPVTTTYSYIYIDDVVWEPTQPTLNVTPTSLAFGYVISGGTSTEQTYSLSGTYLTGAPGNITVTAPSTNFEVSLTTLTGFGSSVLVPFTGPTLAATTIFVRFKPTSPLTDYTGNITNAGGGATTANVAVTGTTNLVYCTPTYSSGGSTDYMTLVTLGTLTQATSSNVSPYYLNYTATQNAIPDLQQGSSTNSLSITFSSDGNQYNGVWIDFDKSGTFATTEFFTSGTNAGANGTAVVNITVPNGATLGNTRMRIRGGEDSQVLNTQACGASSSSFGQAQDYLVNITAATTPLLGASPASLDFGFIPAGNTSAEQSYVLTGLSLSPASGDITVTAPTGFILCLTSGGTYTSPLTVPYTGSALTQTVYVKFSPSVPGVYSANVTNAGGGATTFNVAVSGTTYVTYCSAGSTADPCDEYISNVVVGTISNATDCSTGGYADYTAQSTDMSIGVGYAITVSNGPPSYGSDQCGIWADWNKDGDFADANETITVTGNPSVGPYTAIITPPAGANIGTTRLRVRILYTGTISPCGNTSYGEVEDYTINVVTPTTPLLIPAPTSLAFGHIPVGNTSTEQSYVLTGTNLTPASDNITITAPTGFSICLTAGGTYTNILNVPYTGGAITQTVFVKFSPSTPGGYSANITNAGGSATTANVAVTGTTFFTYCACASGGTLWEYITDVVATGGINNSGTGHTTYSDFAAQSSTIQQGVGMTVTISGIDWYSLDAAYIFIDYNQDGDLTDPGELVGSASGDVTPYVISFTIPIDATIGYTRMRIKFGDTDGTIPMNDTPCQTGYTYGETEDYSINITPAPTCIPPSAQTVANITQTSADLGWTDASGTWDLYIVPAGDPAPTNLSTPTVSGITVNPYPWSGGTANTSYDWYVRRDCGLGDRSDWVGYSRFTTRQVPATLPFSETFETWPHNWTVINGAQTNKWEVGTAVAHAGTKSAYISNDGGVTHYYNVDAASVTHLYRDITFSGAGPAGYTLKFWWEGTAESCCDFLQVFVVNPTTLPVAGVQLPLTDQVGVNYNSMGSWVEATISLPASYTGNTKRLIFSWFNDGNTGTQPPAAIDDISINAIFCPVPTALGSSNITPTTADLNWTAGGSETEWQVIYGPYGFNPALTGTKTGAIYTKPYTLNPPLTPNFNYEWYVRGICGIGDTSAWSAPNNFITPCAYVTVYPWNEGFEGVWPPDCWTDQVKTDFGWDKSINGLPAHGGSEYAYCNLADSPLLTPGLTLATDSRLVFWFRVEDQESPQDLEVRIGANVIYTITNANNIDWQEVQVPLTAYTTQTVTISFVGLTGTGDLSRGILLDDVTVRSNNNTWTGVFSTNWNDTRNWSAGFIPDQFDVVYISSNPTGSRFPVIGSGISAECWDITVAPGADLIIQNGGTLTVRKP